jgi:transcriptional regulator with XRE-family HTH domain
MADPSAQRSPTPPKVERDGELGSRIRRYRLERGLTLAALATKVGVTRSFLSSVERGVVYPSILVLRTIALALDVPVFLLFTAPESNGTVVRPEQRKVVRPPDSSVGYELLSPDLLRRIEFIIMRLDAGAESPPLSHEGEECSYLLQGAVVVRVADESYRMSAGDAIYFNSGLPHSVRNESDGESVMIAAITPPRF